MGSCPLACNPSAAGVRHGVAVHAASAEGVLGLPMAPCWRPLHQ